jgi:hypothetical protein
MKTDAYRVGAATRDLTPDLRETVYLAGFAPNRTAQEIIHPLEVSALYVDDGEKVICFVTLDLIGLLQPDLERIRDRVAHLLPRESVIPCCTHTHSGPDTLGLWGRTALGIPVQSGVDECYLEQVIATAAATIEAAIYAAQTSTLHSFNFTSPPHWVRNERKGGGDFNRVSGLLVRRNQEPYAVLLNFAAHPEALWEKNRGISPDYPAPFRTQMKALGIPFPLFFSGPIGAMLTPDVNLDAGQNERVKYIEFFGRMLARETFRILPGARQISGPLAVREEAVTLINANPRYSLARRLGFIRRPMTRSRIETRVATGCIGPLWFTTVPGEPSPEVGHEIAALLGGKDNLILALGLDELGYIIPTDFFRNQEYRYEQTMSVGAHLVPLLLATISRLKEKVEDDLRR